MNWGLINSIILFLIVLEAEKSKLKALIGLESGEHCFPAHGWRILCVHMVEGTRGLTSADPVSEEHGASSHVTVFTVRNE